MCLENLHRLLFKNKNYRLLVLYSLNYITARQLENGAKLRFN